MADRLLNKLANVHDAVLEAEIAQNIDRAAALSVDYAQIESELNSIEQMVLFQSISHSQPCYIHH